MNSDKNFKKEERKIKKEMDRFNKLTGYNDLDDWQEYMSKEWSKRDKNKTNIKPIGTVKKIYVKEIMSYKEGLELEGSYLDENYYKHKAKENNIKNWIINFDCDVYIKIKGKEKLLFIFRKKVISEKIIKLGIDNFRKVAKQKKINRGSYSGKLDRKKMPRYVGEWYHPGTFMTRYYSSVSGKLGKTTISNMSPSNIVGYYDRPDRNLKGKGSNLRKTQFLRDYPIRWIMGVEYLKELFRIYKNLYEDLPGDNPYKLQMKDACVAKNACINNTCFSTATVNYSSRSAMHIDKKNKDGGIAVLSVIEDYINPNTYGSSYLGLPQYGVCVDVRHGDIIICDNRELWHGNTEYVQKKNKIYDMGEKYLNGKIIKLTEPEIINKWYFNRFSVVAYMRDDIVRNIIKNKGKCINNIDSLGIQFGGKIIQLKYLRKLIDQGYSIKYVLHKLTKYLTK
jgi:hypothetical protein